MKATGTSKSEEKTAQTEAAAWLMRRDMGFRPEDEREYARWLSSDPQHLAAARRVERARAILEKLPRTTAAAPASSEATPRVVIRFPIWRVAAIAALFVLGLSAWWFRPGHHVYERTLSTAAVGLEHLALPDGSSVEVNSQTEISFRFTAGERRVTLARGEAHFHVAKNKARPFIVSAGSVSVRAVGTAFDVHWGAEAVDVLVTEGRVQVSRSEPESPTVADALPGSQAAPSRQSPSPSEPILVDAGQSVRVPLLSVAAPEVKVLAPQAIQEKLAWQEPRLVFANTPLGQVAKEFNRRNSVQIVLSDPELEKLPVVGSFSGDNVEAFVRLLESGHDVTVERRGVSVIVLHPLSR